MELFFNRYCFCVVFVLSIYQCKNSAKSTVDEMNAMYAEKTIKISGNKGKYNKTVNWWWDINFKCNRKLIGNK